MPISFYDTSNSEPNVKISIHSAPLWKIKVDVKAYGMLFSTNWQGFLTSSHKESGDNESLLVFGIPPT